MPRVRIVLPAELGPGNTERASAGEGSRTGVRYGGRADGAGEGDPLILRWFETWARGASGALARLR